MTRSEPVESNETMKTEQSKQVTAHTQHGTGRDILFFCDNRGKVAFPAADWRNLKCETDN
jgi:hypothetical protein